MTRRIAAGLVLAALTVLGGCATKPDPIASTDDPALAEIREAFQRAVQRAGDDPAIDWHSGWSGNLWINFWGANNRGLCHHWQAYTYDEVIATVERVRWEACGVAVNRETKNEHHAVLVWDPAGVSRDEIAGALPHALPGAPTYVLDPWRYGRADIWRLGDWIAIPRRIRTPPELEDLPSPDPS